MPLRTGYASSSVFKSSEDLFGFFLDFTRPLTLLMTSGRVRNGDVRLLQMIEGNGDTANNLIRTLPEVISKVSGLVKSKKKPSKSSDDLNTDEEA